MPRLDRAFGAVVLALLTANCSPRAEDSGSALAEATQALREGRSTDAVKLAQAGAERVADDPASRIQYRLLEAEARLFLRQPKEAAELLAEPIPDAAQFAPSRGRRAYLEGYVEVLERNPAALDTLAKAASDALALGLLDVSLDATVLQGQRLLQQGQFDVAEQLLSAALSRSANAVAYQRGAILVNLGMSRLVRNRFDEALPYFERVLADVSLETTLVYRIALQNAGTCHARLGDLDRAVALQRRAVEGHERARLPQYLEQSLGELGITLMLQGDSAQGLPTLNRALDIATANEFASDAAVWAGNLAIAYGDLRDWDRAEHFNNVATELKKTAGSTRLTYNIYNRARVAHGRGRTDEAIATFEDAIRQATDDPYAAWESHAGLAQVYRQTGRMPDAITHYEQALGTIERTRAELLTREYRLTFLSRLIRFHQDYVDALVENGDIERALEVAESSRARVLAERQGVARLDRVPAAEFVKLAKRTGTTLLSYWLGPTRSFVWVITGAGIRCVTLPARQEIEAQVRSYRDFVTVSLADPLAASTSPGTRLSETLLNPVLDAIPAGTSVVIVPDAALHSLSFEMLPLTTPQPHYWIEDVTVRLAPSLALAAAPSVPRANAAPSLLLIGDPTHIDQTLPPLTFAGTELSGIERAFGGQTELLRGAEATPRAVTASQPARFSLIHFAAHATASAESPLDSAILLSPEPLDLGTAKAVPSVRSADPGTAKAVPYSGEAARAPSPEPQGPSRQASKRSSPEPQAPSLQASKPSGPEPQAPSLSSYKLYARDVTALALNADVVTLSACRSAGGRAYGGEGLVGFSWAFLRAGARQVVAGLWDVDDQSTALLMERFYARLGAGAPPAAALRDAKLSLLRGSGNFRKPYYWAAFAVFSTSLDPS